LSMNNIRPCRFYPNANNLNTDTHDVVIVAANETLQIRAEVLTYVISCFRKRAHQALEFLILALMSFPGSVLRLGYLFIHSFSFLPPLCYLFIRSSPSPLLSVCTIGPSYVVPELRTSRSFLNLPRVPGYCLCYTQRNG